MRIKFNLQKSNDLKPQKRKVRELLRFLNRIYLTINKNIKKNKNRIGINLPLGKQITRMVPKLILIAKNKVLIK